jgi:hypothetical protein
VGTVKQKLVSMRDMGLINYFLYGMG